MWMACGRWLCNVDMFHIQSQSLRPEKGQHPPITTSNINKAAYRSEKLEDDQLLMKVIDI